MNATSIRTKDFFDAFRRCDYPDASIDEILRHLAVRLTGYFRKLYLGHAADIHDLVQDTMVRLLQAVEKYDPSRSPWLWMKGIARNVLREWLKHKRQERSRMRTYADALAAKVPEPDWEERETEFASLRERLALAVDAQRKRTRMDSDKFEAGLELLQGATRSAVMTRYRMTPRQLDRAKCDVKCTLRKSLV